MTHSNSPPSRKIAVIGASLVGLSLAAAGVSFLYKNRVPAAQDFITLGDLPAGVKTEVLLETPGRRANILAASGKNGFSLPPAWQAAPVMPYRISTSLKMPQGDYHDLVLNIGKDGKTFAILADGFTQYDYITLTLDGSAVYKNVPMDWSGRMELKTDLPQGKSVNACVSIKGQEQSIGLCHTIETEHHPA